jgi:spore coat polysaccharide biosynthesis protein SpsF (cytidylyltransferase family)
MSEGVAGQPLAKPRTVAVIQARMGSTRLPGKVLAVVGHRPLVLWTVAAARAIAGINRVVVATTLEAVDDPLVELLVADGIDHYRGSVQDVLTRTWEAVQADEPDVVVRATADNPFMDPSAVGAQLRRCIDAGFDYVGTAGWPLGIAAEVARGTALLAAFREATDPAEREHVMPFIYARPDRFRIGSAPPATPPPDGRFTVDTAEDLSFARALAERLGPVATCSIEQLRRIVTDEPELLAINAGVRQKPWQEAQQA